MNLFELFVKVGVDDQASGKLRTITTKLGNGLKTAAKIGTAAVAAAATGIVTLTKKSVESYAQYEQLVGGVDTLFKKSSKKVQKYAENAYKTAGLSANEYMETVTSFSASLLQSLEQDTEKAAEYADMAITDMSDNANKMGTSMEMIQNAYQGFAKQNYTMLDNLKLGYGGTKTEMERLVKDAEKLKKSFKATRDENGELVLSFSDIVDAIHIVQDEMGITGTTAEEAAETISGSITTMKKAWGNLVTALGDENANIEDLMDKLVDTLVGEDGRGGVVGNLLPRIEKVIEGIGKLVDRMVPAIIESIPGLIERFLPMLTESAMHLVETIIETIGNNSESLSKSLVSSLSQIVSHAAKNTPALIGSVLDLIISLISEIGNNLGTIIPELINSITKVFTEIANRASAFTGAVFSIINGIVDALTSPEGLAEMTVVGFELLIAILEGMILAAPSLILNIGKVITTIIDNFKNAGWKEIGNNMFSDIGGSFKESWGRIKSSFSDFGKMFSAGLNTVGDFFSDVWDSVTGFFSNIWDHITGFFSNIWGHITSFFSNIWANIQEFLSKPGYYIGYALGSIVAKLKEFFTVTIPNVWNNFTTWISDSFNKLINSVKTFFTETIPNFFTGLLEKVKEFFRNAATTVKEFFTVTIPEKWNNFKKKATEKINGIADWFKSLPGKLKEVGSNIVNGLWNGIKSAWSWLKENVSNLINNLVQGVKDGLGIKSPSRVFAGIGENMALGLAKGWDDEFSDISKDITDSMAFDDFDLGVAHHSDGILSSKSAFGNNYLDVSINIDGAKYTDEQSLASAIALEIQNMTDRRAAVYA